MFFVSSCNYVVIGTYTFFNTCVAMETVYEINSWRYFAVVSLRMEGKSWKWFNSLAWKSRRHRESRADRRFGGELREETGGDFRAERRNREAKCELKIFHVFQWAERDAISPRVSCVSTFREELAGVHQALGNTYGRFPPPQDRIGWANKGQQLTSCRSKKVSFYFLKR